jgi:hypothetical protein
MGLEAHAGRIPMVADLKKLLDPARVTCVLFFVFVCDGVSGVEAVGGCVSVEVMFCRSMLSQAR